MKKKNLKGFTLIEVLIALAVFAIIALLISTMYVTAAKLSVDASKLNNKAEFQVQEAEAGSVSNAVLDASANTIQFNFALAKQTTVSNNPCGDIGVSTYAVKPVDIDGTVQSTNDPPDIIFYVLN